MIYNLSEHNSIASLFISELRDAEIQKDKLKFRENLRKVSQVLAYELSRTFKYTNKLIETPLGALNMALPQAQIVLVPILRSGVAMHQGLMDFFPNAESSFMSTTRTVHKDGTMEISLDYVSSPAVDDRIVILADPLIATGSTISKAYKTILEFGKPTAIHVVSVIAYDDGIKYLKRTIPKLSIWTGAIDEELTAKSLIVPGLGDVDELSFGKAIDLEE
jgi:uracil phosphoribosyltransferase